MATTETTTVEVTGEATTPERAYEEQRQLEEDLLAGHGDEDGTGLNLNPDLLDVTMEDADALEAAPRPANPIMGAEAASIANPPEGAVEAAPRPLGAIQRASLNTGATGGPSSTQQRTEAAREVTGRFQISHSNSNPIAGNISPGKLSALRMYEAAKNVYQNVNIPSLHGGEARTLPPIGSLVLTADDRWQSTKLFSNIATGVNISYSFDPNTMECGCCGKFLEAADREKGLVWVFSDQNFSPILPAIDRNCVKIIRSEGEDLLQMTSNFLLKYGSAIVDNDVILIGSANQLLKEGLTGYIGSILDTMDRVCVGPRFGCTILPAPFILLGGCDDPQLVRSIMDFHAWIRLSGVDRGGILSDALAAVERHILSSGSAKYTWTSISYKIPLNLPSKRKSCIFSPGSTNLPAGVDPVPESVEKLIIHALTTGIKHCYREINIECAPITNRQLANSTKECRKYVLIGGHHAEATATVLQEMGNSCQTIILPHYRASAIYSGKVQDSLGNMQLDEDTILVLQVFDSGFFWVRTEDGSIIPPCRRADGSYHIDGELEVVSRDQQYDFFRHLMSELVMHKEKQMIFLAPLPRYLEESCCGDPEHVANRSQQDYKKKQEEAIFASRQNIKNFAFRQGLRRCITVSSWGKVRHLEEIWKGPTELTPPGYSKLAEAVVEAAADLQKKRKPDVGSNNAPKRGRMDQQTGPRGAAISAPQQPTGGPRGRGHIGGRGQMRYRGRREDTTHQPQGGSAGGVQFGAVDVRLVPGPIQDRGRGGRGARGGQGRWAARGRHGRAGRR
jgi:hypothetical protein